MFSCFFLFVCLFHFFNAVLAQTGKKHMTAVKACFSAGWPMWPSDAAFVMLAQVYPNHEPLLMFLFSTNFHCCSLVPRWRALLLGAHGLGEERVEILRHVGFTTWCLV